MKSKIILTVGSALLVGAVAAQAAGNVQLDVASAYVFRGTTLNDGFVAQPTVETAGHGFTFGAWGNFDLDSYTSGDTTLNSGQFSEIDLYASYAIPLETDEYGLSLGIIEYTYPGATGDSDRELNLVGSVNTILNPTLGVYLGIDGSIDSDVYVELTGEHSIDLDEGLTGTIGGVLGYLSPDMGEDGFSHLTLSASLGYGMFSAGVDFIVETDDKVLLVDEEFVGKVGFSHDF